MRETETLVSECLCVFVGSLRARQQLQMKECTIIKDYIKPYVSEQSGELYRYDQLTK